MVWKYIKNGESLRIDNEKCTGCGTCLEVCPHSVFLIKNKKAIINLKQACMECGACSLNCPAGAIEVNSGVGCVGAVIKGMLGNTSPDCGCGSSKSSGSCC